MQEEERIALSRLFGMDHNIDMSTIYKEGDSIKIASGPFVGQESRILKINKNRHQATIKFFDTVPAVHVNAVQKIIMIYVKPRRDTCVLNSPMTSALLLHSLTGNLSVKI